MAGDLIFVHNTIAGGIPAEIGNLQNLECLDIEGCALSGKLYN